VSLRQQYLKILSALVPIGAVAASLLLGSMMPAMANDKPSRWQPDAYGEARVAQKLAAIRQAVSEVAAGNRESDKVRRQLAWWGNWRNGGGAVGAWRNGGWRNGGWLNGGWRNGGWPNFWRNW
jgi:rSAM-associated Gly-rich repeat protein